MVKKWEYKITNFVWESDFNELGLEGCELVAISGENCVFKRQI